MATTTMDRQERLERGEKFLVFAVMTVLGVEGFFTILAAGIRFSWLGLVWAAGSSVFVLLLANQLYAGNRTAHKVGSVWSAFQVALSLLVLLVLAFQPEASATTSHIALPALWMAGVKLLAYIVLSTALFLAPPVRDFLGVQGGAELAPEIPLAPTGVEVTFAEDQKQVIASLGRLLSAAAAVLIVLGMLQALFAFREFVSIAQSENAGVMQTLGLWLFIRFLPAVATVSIGILMYPSSSAAKLIRTQGTDMSYIMNFLIRLRGFFACLVILIGIHVLGALLGVPMF
jgi:hypothetical protein